MAMFGGKVPENDPDLKLRTAVDQQCEEKIRGIVEMHFPSHTFLGEETAGPDLDATLASGGWLWIVDPIDGTTNFAAGQPMSAVSIGVAFDGKLQAGVIYEPFRDELFAAARGAGATLNGASISVSKTDTLSKAVVASGAPPNPRSAAPCFRAMTLLAPPKTRTIRILGSAAINFAWLACGRLDAWFEADLNSWDSAAGVLLVEEAGGAVTDCLGTPFALTTRPICATNGRIHAELLEVLAVSRCTGLDVD
ncbi:IMP2 [Symbiodinium natans]|uniref:Inositol-1-monophosphatase n=1 Tax=Symbiodinium natans TaxID=878477 RepID=A0A812Q3T9_9DINO|nr:IMP2 [Symbiodinium natans]